MHVWSSSSPATIPDLVKIQRNPNIVISKKFAKLFHLFSETLILFDEFSRIGCILLLRFQCQIRLLGSLLFRLFDAGNAPLPDLRPQWLSDNCQSQHSCTSNANSEK
jgi:hypothetical protein